MQDLRIEEAREDQVVLEQAAAAAPAQAGAIRRVGLVRVQAWFHFWSTLYSALRVAAVRYFYCIHLLLVGVWGLSPKGTVP